MQLITLLLFASGIAMGIAAALMWAWGVRSGQFRDLEKTKHQLFWPELASMDDVDPVGSPSAGADGTRTAGAVGNSGPTRRRG